MDVERERSIMVVAAILVVFSAVIAVRGIKYGSSTGTCYSAQKLCHGVPAGEQCIGTVTYETEFQSRKNCGVVENISRRCNSLGEKVCSLNNRSIGTAWASKAEVFGQKCSSWRREYGIDLRSC